MDETNEQVDVDLDVEEEVDTDVDTEPEATETTDWEARAKRLEEKAIAQRERTRALKAEMTRLKKAQETKAESKTGELDNADYAFLAVKGYEHDDDIKLISEKMKKWNLPLRELLRDEDVVNRLKSMRIEREALAATPGSTRRSSGNAADTEDYFYQKYEQTGKLPDNMPHGMAEKLINRKYAEANPRQNPYE